TTGQAKNVDEYLHSLPKEVRTTLEKIRQTIKAAAPKAEEIISYQIPTYQYLGPLVHFAAFEKHCSFVVVSKDTLSHLQRDNKDLQSYKISGTTIHFTPDKPLPEALIRKIVKARIKENEERHATKRGDNTEK
ncbi:MAG: iron chaperone, partial [Chitinophagaceae bacterium]